MKIRAYRIGGAISGFMCSLCSILIWSSWKRFSFTFIQFFVCSPFILALLVLLELLRNHREFIVCRLPKIHVFLLHSHRLSFLGHFSCRSSNLLHICGYPASNTHHSLLSCPSNSRQHTSFRRSSDRLLLRASYYSSTRLHSYDHLFVCIFLSLLSFLTTSLLRKRIHLPTGTCLSHV